VTLPALTSLFLLRWQFRRRLGTNAVATVA
jgi:hypothetical protein